MTAGEMLKTWRLGKGLSQAVAAKLFGLNQVRWHRLEAGSSLPGANEAIRIDQGTKGAVPATAWPDKIGPTKVEDKCTEPDVKTGTGNCK